MTPNRYRVQKDQWSKWTDDGRSAFNEMYADMLANQHLWMHPAASPMTALHWKTTCWNAAWWAADIATRAEKARKPIKVRRIRNALDDLALTIKTWSNRRRRLYDQASAELKRAGA